MNLGRHLKYHTHMCLLQLIGTNVYPIRVSVDALYRDGIGQISRDPRTKRLKSLRE